EDPPDLEEGHSDLASLFAAAVGRWGFGESLVGLGIGELVLGLLELAQQCRQLRQQGVRLLPGEVALVDQLGAFVGHARAAGICDARRSRSSSASASPMVRN